MNEDGAVSVYFILIIIPIFMFTATMIDFARVGLTSKEAETAVKAGIRSTMSAFDPKLRDFGLFGQGLSQAENTELFVRVVRANLSSQTESLRYIDPMLQPDSESIVSMYSLADHTVMKQQILNDMKYKAPFEFTFLVINTLKEPKVIDRLTQASAFQKLSYKLEYLFEQREDKLDEAWNETTKLKGHFEVYHSYYRDLLDRIYNLEKEIGPYESEEVSAIVRTIELELISLNRNQVELSSSLQRINQSIMAVGMGGGGWEIIYPLVEQREQLEKSLQEAENQIRIANLEKERWEKLLEQILQYEALIQEASTQVISDDAHVLQSERMIERALSEASQLNWQIREEMEAADSTSNDEGWEELPARDVLTGLVVPDDYFYKYRTQVGAAASAFHGFKQRIVSLSRPIADSYRRLGEDNELYHEIIIELYNLFHEDEESRNHKRNEIRRLQKEEEGKLQDVLDKLKQAVFRCPSVLPERLASLNEKYLGFNEVAVSDVSVVKLDDARHTGRHTFGMIDKLIGSLTDVRDELYVNEYAITHFSYRTSDSVEQNRNSNDKRSMQSSRTTYLQELEYIIYGFTSCEANYSAAYAEMFALRLAVHTLEALLDPRNELLNIGSPWLLLLAALAEGGVKAYGDMEKLVAGESVPVSSKLSNMTMDYKDYLRIFMFLHHHDRQLMARMQSLIELNTNHDLTLFTTYMQATAVTSVKLWFIPGVMNVLTNVGMSDCIIRKDRCELIHSAVFAY